MIQNLITYDIWVGYYRWFILFLNPQKRQSRKTAFFTFSIAIHLSQIAKIINKT